MNRRMFLRGAATGGAAVLAGLGSGCSWVGGGEVRGGFELEEMTLVELGLRMEKGELTSEACVRAYMERITRMDRVEGGVNSVIELNPDALAMSRALDEERLERGVRGALHGVPVLIKDNIDTHDRMLTTAGSLALEGSVPVRDAFVVERLREAGAVILGKANLSEWANFRGSRSISGWSGRGGQTRNPYVLDRSPSGSSSGSAAAVSANFCMVAVGTETNGSIVSPSSYCGVVGIKPTVGLVSRSGIIPISSSQDTAGPIARCVADAAVLLGAMVGEDSRDAATGVLRGRGQLDYTRYLDQGALEGARLGIARSHFRMNHLVDPVMDRAVGMLRGAGAELVDPFELPSTRELGGADYEVMLYEFKSGLNAYFAGLGADAPLRSLEQLIAFNEEHRDRELALFGQEILIEAQAKGDLGDEAYVRAKKRCLVWRDALAKAIEDRKLDAVVAPTNGPAHVLDPLVGDRWLGSSSTYAAVAGYPNITVPCGDVSGLPVSLSFFGTAWSEPKLIGIAYAFEQMSRARRAPRFLGTLGAEL
ncbi:MAG: amidase [Verrucomicrobiota bacterium]